MRSFKTFFTEEQLARYQRGVRGYSYRGRLCNKSPIDIALYIRLIDEVKPETLFEIGSYHGGSAHLFRDIGRMLDNYFPVYSIDRKSPDATINGVTFLHGDVMNLEVTFLLNDLFALRRPWLVVEDSAHTCEACLAALKFFGQHLRSGEWLVMEDGVLEDLGMSERYGGGPNKAIAEFMETHPGIFAVQPSYCDAFGPNATYSPNGWLKRTSKAW